ARRHEVLEVPGPAPDDLSEMEAHLVPEDRAAGHERVELSVLPTRIHGLGEIREEPAIEAPAGERPAEHPGIDAGDHALIAAVDERAGKLKRIPLPDRKERVHPLPSQPLLPVLPDVRQEQVPKGD